MKKAFTLLELIFVIVVIGILAGAIIPNVKSSSLYDAASQVVSHIRYVQHLAMIDDKFNSKDEDWYKTRWQIKFSKVSGSDNKWAYAIFHDLDKDSSPDANEIAINPLDNTKKLTGGYTGAIEYSSKTATKELNLGNKYSIMDVDFNNCGINNNDEKKRIFFDNLGRPYSDNPNLLDSIFKDGSKSRLLKQSCQIILCNTADCNTADKKDKVIIEIEKNS